MKLNKKTWRTIQTIMLIAMYGIVFINYILLFSKASDNIVRIGTIFTITIILGLYSWSLKRKENMPKLSRYLKLIALIGSILPSLTVLLFNIDLDKISGHFNFHNLMIIVVGMEIIDVYFES